MDKDRNSSAPMGESSYDPDAAKAERRRQRKRQRKKSQRFWDRVAAFIIVTVLVLGTAALTAEGVIIKGPSPTLEKNFVYTMLQTRRFKWVPHLFLTDGQINNFPLRPTPPPPEPTEDPEPEPTFHPSPIPSPWTEKDTDGDGIVLEEIKGAGFAGYMLVVLDPTRVFVGMPDSFGGVGLTLEEMCAKYDAVAGINAGGFKDDGGGGFGGLPEGLTIVDGVCYNDEAFAVSGFCGLDGDGKLHVGWYTLEDCEARGIRDAVSFGPILIENGVPTGPEYLPAGVNPRTAIGQTSTGEIILLVIDGRQLRSMGAMFQDVVDILLDNDVVNALNLDGGSSTSMYYNGEYVNRCSAMNGKPRPLPTAFLVKQQ